MQRYIVITPTLPISRSRFLMTELPIFSPGKLYGGLTIDDLKTDTYQSRARNKLIAEAFYLTNNIKMYGSGYIRIRKELETYPERIFSVEEMGGGVLVTFKQNEGVNELYNCILQRPGLRLPEITEHLQVPAKILERWIKQLRDENKVVFKGSAKTGGYYAISAEEIQ